MSDGAATQLLDHIISNAEEKLEQPSTATNVCSSHDDIRVGVHALLLCEKDRRSRAHPLVQQLPKSGNFLQFGKFKAVGWPAITVGIAVAVLIIARYTLPTAPANADDQRAAIHQAVVHSMRQIYEGKP